MRIILAGLLFGLLVLATKADEPVETEYEDPVEELNDLVDWEVEDDGEEKPTSVEMAVKALVDCVSTGKAHGKMTRECMMKFKRRIPKKERKRNELFKCALEAMDGCKRRPKKIEVFANCMQRLMQCISGEEGIEGSGQRFF